MPSIRRSGGAVTFFWQGKLPDPRQPEFGEALARQRFRTIEDASSEETSIGWVTAVDPTGDSFAPDDLQAGTATWLRIRIDRKVLPRKWLAIHRAAAERAQGRKLSARERRELKDDLTSKLLPRVLPNVDLIDALLFWDRRTVMLLHTGKSIGEQFHKLFFQTFALPLERANPLVSGLHVGLDQALTDRLERAEAVRWPRRTRSSGGNELDREVETGADDDATTRTTAPTHDAESAEVEA